MRRKINAVRQKRVQYDIPSYVCTYTVIYYENSYLSTTTAASVIPLSIGTRFLYY